jgi:hypothetical protein
MTGLLSLAAILISIWVGYQSSIWSGVFVGLGFFVATGAGSVIRRSVRGTLKAPLAMFAISAAVLALAYWLGAHAQLVVVFGGSPRVLNGEWWAVIGGTIAGLFLGEDEEKPAI